MTLLDGLHRIFGRDVVAARAVREAGMVSHAIPHLHRSPASRWAFTESGEGEDGAGAGVVRETPEREREKERARI